MTTSTIVSSFPTGFDLSVLQKEDMYHQVTEKNLFVTKSGMYDYSTAVSRLLITIVGGGGAGGVGNISSGVFISGGGGGGGGGHSKVPIIIPEGISSVMLACLIGEGGTLDHPNGGDTIITVICDGLPIKSLVATGGKSATSNYGGSHGIGNSISNGNSGTSGNIVVSSQIQLGGDGGDSIMYTGGKGYNIGMEDTSLCSGYYGSGGGGMIPGLDNTENFGNGGKGAIIVEYN